MGSSVAARWRSRHPGGGDDSEPPGICGGYFQVLCGIDTYNRLLHVVHPFQVQSHCLGAPPANSDGTMALCPTGDEGLGKSICHRNWEYGLMGHEYPR